MPMARIKAAIGDHGAGGTAEGPNPSVRRSHTHKGPALEDPTAYAECNEKMPSNHSPEVHGYVAFGIPV